MLRVKDYLVDQKIMRSDGARQSPTVSVILPTYARYASGRLKRAIESVLSQTFADFELIVVDDGSTDGSNEFIESCRATDPRVVHVRHELNSGLPALRVNEGIELARGRFLAFQFDDDSWRPNALEALVRAAQNQKEPAVIVGHCHAHSPTHEVIYPHRRPELFSLYETNFIANNSVLVPRFLVDQYGMIDCHIAMRRICDWDWWIRYIRHCRFEVIDAVVSDVEPGLPDSIGATARYPASIVRFFQSVSRDEMLKPENWREYEVDSLELGRTRVGGELRRRLYEEHIVPYYAKHRHQFRQIENFPTTLPRSPKTVLCTMEALSDPLYEILTQHNEASKSRMSFVTYVQLQAQMRPCQKPEADILLLMRVLNNSAVELMNLGLCEQLPVAYFLDDDFLRIHECGSEFDCLKPGTPERQNLTRMLKDADAVWVSAKSIGESVNAFNPRTVAYAGAVSEKALPTDIRPRNPEEPLRIACTSGPYRHEEIKHLWDALVCLSQRYGDRVVFEFWGVDPSSLRSLSSPSVHRPFAHSYTLYLEELRQANFDVFLAPLLGEPRARLGKAPNKYYLAAVAGALGIFSDVQPYEMLPGNLTCLKVENSVDAWYGALCEAAEMAPAQFDLMRRRMLAHVREEFTDQAQIFVHEAAIRATEFHAHTRKQRRSDGRPRVVLFAPPFETKTDEANLAQRIRLMRDYGFEPVIIFPHKDESASRNGEPQNLRRLEGIETHQLSGNTETSVDARVELQSIIERQNASIVHSFGLSLVITRICRRLNIPHVSSLNKMNARTRWRGSFSYGKIIETESLSASERLSELFEMETFCARGVVAQEVFDVGMRRRLEAIGQQASPKQSLRILIAGRTAEEVRMLEAIAPLSKSHSHVRIDVDSIKSDEYRSSRADVVSNADILLCVPSADKFSPEIKDAMAAGVLVVTPSNNVIDELIIDRVTGIVCQSDTARDLKAGLQRAIELSELQRRAIIDQARRVARAEFHPSRAANDLLTTYNRAIEIVDRPNKLSAEELVIRDKNETAEICEEPRWPPRGHVPVSNRVKFSVVPAHHNWNGLEVLVGTHMKAAHGWLHLQIRSDTGELLREASQELTHVADNDWAIFRFGAIPEAAEKTFIAEFELDKRDPKTKISIYENTPLENIMRRTLRRAGVSGLRPNLHCRLFYKV